MFIGIVMGSTFSIAIGLAMTWVVLLLLPEHSERLAPEKAPLAQALGLATIVTALAALSFYGELRGRPWRGWAHVGLVLCLGLATWVYWPA